MQLVSCSSPQRCSHTHSFELPTAATCLQDYIDYPACPLPDVTDPLWHRIVSPFSKRMASVEQTPHCRVIDLHSTSSPTYFGPIMAPMITDWRQRSPVGCVLSDPRVS